LAPSFGQVWGLFFYDLLVSPRPKPDQHPNIFRLDYPADFTFGVVGGWDIL